MAGQLSKGNEKFSNLRGNWYRRIEERESQHGEQVSRRPVFRGTFP